MTYDQWFRSQQEIPWEGMFMFAGAAWDQQQQRIDDQAAMIRQMALEYISDQGQWIDELATYKALCDQLGNAVEEAMYANSTDVAKMLTHNALAAWREMKGGCDVHNSE